MNTQTPAPQPFVLRISAGTGPVEVRRFVGLLARELVERFTDAGLELLAEPSMDAPARSLELRVRGDRRVFAAWTGTHALIAASRRDRPGRHRGHRKRWFVHVSLRKIADTPPTALDPRDVEIQCCRAGGPGGQHVNTTDTAVRAVHLPSGLAVRVADSRSQADNRARAIDRLAAKLQRQHEQRSAFDRRLERLLVTGFARGGPTHTWRLDPRGRLQRD